MGLSRFARQVNAVQFFYGGPLTDSPAPLRVVAAPGVSGSQTITVYGGVIALSDGTTYTAAFNTNAPISVGSAGNAETVTPSGVSNNVQNSAFGITATATATFSNAHYPGDIVTSGTAGLQEAINWLNSVGGGTVIVDSTWTSSGGTSTILNAAALPANGTVQILDNRGGSGSVTSVLTVAIPNAQVLTLNSVGVPLIPAPGAGNLIQVDRLWVEQIAVTAAFASGGAITAAYGTQASQTAATGAIAVSVLTGGAGTTNQIGSALAVAPANGNSSVLLNKAVGLYAATADFTTGGGSIICKIAYRILTGF